MDLKPFIDRAARLKRQVAKEPPVRYQVLGERCSGTNFLDNLIAANFAMKRSYAMAWKHGFPDILAAPKDVVFVVIFREVFGWLQSMYGKPWHSTEEIRALPFADFIRSEWRSTVDAPEHFRLESGDSRIGQPLNYDLHPITGQPFASLVELRNAKAESLLSLPARGARVIYCTLDSVTRDPQATVRRIAAETGLDPSAEVSVPQGHYGWSWQDRTVGARKGEDLFGPEDRDWVLRTVDPALEQRMGFTYSAREPADAALIGAD